MKIFFKKLKDLKIIELYIPPLSYQKFLLKVKFFIKHQDISQDKIDKFALEELSKPRYKYLIENVFPIFNFKVKKIKYEKSHAIFQLSTHLNNINILTIRDIRNEIKNSTWYDSSVLKYMEEPCEHGGHYEYCLDFRNNDMIEITEI